MKITLTQPFVPGDHDPGRTYPHVFIDSVINDRNGESISITYAYGTVSNSRKKLAEGGFLFDSRFEKGSATPIGTYNVQGDEYLSLKASSKVVPGDTVYEACLRLMYQALIDSHRVTGKVVNP